MAEDGGERPPEHSAESQAPAEPRGHWFTTVSA